MIPSKANGSRGNGSHNPHTLRLREKKERAKAILSSLARKGKDEMAKEISMKICKYYDHVFRTGYCNLEKICPNGFIEPAYYNCGKYGWNCDIYVIHGVIITTGYRNTRGTEITSEIINKYGHKAEEIGLSYGDYDDPEEMMADVKSAMKQQRRLAIVSYVYNGDTSKRNGGDCDIFFDFLPEDETLGDARDEAKTAWESLHWRDRHQQRLSLCVVGKDDDIIDVIDEYE